MSNNTSSNATLFIVLGIVGFIVTLLVIIGVMFITVGNTGNDFEHRLEAVWKNNEVILSNYTKQISEAAQLPTMATDDMVRTIDAAVKGRYGADGSKAVFQMITEQNPTVGPALYTKIQQLIESGRNKFESNQKELIDIRRTYETALGSIPTGMIMKFMGYPRVDLSKYKIISDEATQAAFASGKDQALTLRPKQ